MVIMTHDMFLSDWTAVLLAVLMHSMNETESPILHQQALASKK